jgi:hypothetical protein
MTEVFFFFGLINNGVISSDYIASNGKMIYSSKMLILIHHTRCHNLDNHNMNLHCGGIILYMLQYLFWKELILHTNTSHSILKLRIFHIKLHMQLIFQNSTMKSSIHYLHTDLWTQRFINNITFHLICR